MEKLIAKVQTAYGLKILDYYPHANIWCLETSKGRKCLKKVRYSKEDARFIWLATENLYNNCFERFNRFVLSTKGEPFLEHDGGVYTLTDWMSGRQSDYTEQELLLIAIQTLADMHQASLGFYPTKQGKHRVKWGYWIDNFEERAEELLKFKKFSQCKETYFDEMFFMHADEHIAEAQEAIAKLKESAYYRLVEEESPLNGFCHHDYAYHNVLIHEGQGYLIDFDYIISDLRCHDVASLMMRSIKDNYWQVKPAELVLQEYDRLMGLRRGEPNVMFWFLKFPQEFWQAGYTYYIEQNRPQERMEKRLRNCVTAMELRAKSLQSLAKVCCER